MALDGITLSMLKNELAEKLIGARIDKIHQPSKEELVISLRWNGENGKLLIFFRFSLVVRKRKLGVGVASVLHCYMRYTGTPPCNSVTSVTV